jgi:hypothetical protein
MLSVVEFLLMLITPCMFSIMKPSIRNASAMVISVKTILFIPIISFLESA